MSHYRSFLYLKFFSIAGFLLFFVFSECLLYSQEEARLSIWVMPVAGLGTQNFMEKEAKLFSKLNPGVSIEVKVIDWYSAWDKYMTCVELQEGPDIFQIGTTWLPAIASMDVLVDLTGRMDQVGGVESYPPAVWSSCKIHKNEKIWSVPWLAAPSFLLYRKDIFQELGCTVEDIADWDSFLLTCKKIKEGDAIAPFGLSRRESWSLMHSMAPWIWNAGGHFINEDRTHAAINSSEAFKGIWFLTHLASMGYITKESFNLTHAQVNRGFLEGDFAMIMGEPQMFGAFESSSRIKSDNFGVALIPKGPAGHYSFLGGSNLAIFQFSRYQEEAWAFVKFLASYEAQVRLFNSSSNFPALKSAMDSPELSQFKDIKIIKESINRSRSYPNVPSWGVIESTLVRHFKIIWDHVDGVYGPFNDTSLREELDILAQKIDLILASIEEPHE